MIVFWKHPIICCATCNVPWGVQAHNTKGMVGKSVSTMSAQAHNIWLSTEICAGASHMHSILLVGTSLPFYAQAAQHRKLVLPSCSSMAVCCQVYVTGGGKPLT
jgi:hypothetical protein